MPAPVVTCFLSHLSPSLRFLSSSRLSSSFILPCPIRPAPASRPSRPNGLPIRSAASVSPQTLADSATTPKSHSSSLQYPESPVSSPTTRFFQLLFRQWKLLAPALFAAVVASVASTVAPLIYGTIFAIFTKLHILSPELAKHLLRKRLALLASVFFTENVCTLIYISLSARVADNATRQLREQCFESIMANDVAFFDVADREHLRRTLAIQVKLIRQTIWDNTSQTRGLRPFLEAIFGIGMCIKLAPALSIPIFGVLIPIIAYFVARLTIRTGKLNFRVETKEADIISFMSEKMRGLRTVKAFGAEQKEQSAMTDLLSDARQVSSGYINSRSMNAVANKLNILVPRLMFHIFGGPAVMAGYLSVENFSAMLPFVFLVNFSVNGLFHTLANAAVAEEAIKKVYGVLDHANEHRAKLDASVALLPSALPLSFRGEIRFDNVSLHYPSRPDVHVLKDVSFSIRAGQTVALVGQSGGGKSSIAALLFKFYTPTQGNVFMDGVDVQSIPAARYSQQLSIVDQDPFLFSGTVADNIAYGLPDGVASRDEVEHAARKANAHSFISQLTEGYDTWLDEDTSLSGGQRQRIAIARSLLKEPRVLVLDEATSALDEESERLVQTALDNLRKDRTTLVIAHRLSTVRTADMLLFVKGGRIVERGSFDELYAIEDGHFRAMVQATEAMRN